MYTQHFNWLTSLNNALCQNNNDNNDHISTKTAASLPLFKGQSKEDVDEFLTELLPLSIHVEKTKRLRRALPGMYLSSKETRVTGSLLLTNLVKAIVKALCEQYKSAIRDRTRSSTIKYDRSNKNQDCSAYIRHQCSTSFHGVAWLNSLFSSSHVCGVEIAELKEAVSATDPRIAVIIENYLKILLPNYRFLDW